MNRGLQMADSTKKTIVKLKEIIQARLKLLS